MNPFLIAYEVIKPEFLPGPTETVGEGTRLFVLNETFPLVVNIIIAALGLVTFFGIIFAAVNMLTSFGDEDRINRAKTSLRNGILGFLIVILSYAIVSIIVSIALPQTSFIPHAYAEDEVTSDGKDLSKDGKPVNESAGSSGGASTEKKINLLLPSEDYVVGQHDDRVSLPSGDLVSEIFPAVIANILYFVGFMIFVALMYGGITLVIGRGNEDSITKAKQILLYGAMSLAMIVLAYAIIFNVANLDLSQDEGEVTDDVYPDTFPNDQTP